MKFIAALAVIMALSSTIYAQTPEAKRDLATRIIAAQDGAEMNRMLEQLAGSATQQMVANWNPLVGALPADKRQKAAAAMDVELKKFNDDTLKLVTTQAAKVRSEALTGAYAEKFSDEELKQLLALMEAPAFKKYQTLAPELGSIYFKGIVDGTRSSVEARSKAFDAAATKIVGTSPTAGNGSPAVPPASRKP